MSNTQKLLTACFIISIISFLIMVVSAIINPVTTSLSGAVVSFVVPVVLWFAIASAKKDEKK